jgi:D-arabinose 1-dehydrogenase-like Zn-dependent alcohol dehydrogenase
MSTKMKAAQIGKAGGDWELIERDIPEPSVGQVRVKVEACGICHSDALVKDGIWPGLQYPRVPGHEIAGRIDALGDNVTAWQKNQRVGVGKAAKNLSQAVKGLAVCPASNHHRQTEELQRGET